MKPKISESERAAIDAVKSAIKALPRCIVIEIDDDEGRMSFWKREKNEFGPGVTSAGEASADLRCRRVFCL